MELANALIEELLRLRAISLDGKRDVAGFTLHPTGGLPWALVKRHAMGGVTG